MNKLKEILKREMTGWKKWEVIWLFLATAVILGFRYIGKIQSQV